LIEPHWILLFSKKRGRWWVRLLAWGRYHHVKAIAYLPDLRAWLFYDVKFFGTRLMLAREGDPGTGTFLHGYLDGCDLIAMPRLPVPKRAMPRAGFWCTLAMQHLVGIRPGAWRPDRLWHDSIAAGGTPHQTGLRAGSVVAELPASKDPQPSASVLTFLRAHAQTSSDTPSNWADEAAFSRPPSQSFGRFWTRIRATRRRAGRHGRVGPRPVSA
jgi:hypothetical protein